jgi:hypothetical protein
VVGTLSDDWDQEEETVEARFARLTREVEELKVQMAEQEAKKEADGGIAELAGALEKLATGKEERLQKRLLQTNGSVGVVTKTLPPADREDKEVCVSFPLYCDRSTEVLPGHVERHHGHLQSHVCARPQEKPHAGEDCGIRQAAVGHGADDWNPRVCAG